MRVPDWSSEAYVAQPDSGVRELRAQSLLLLAPAASLIAVGWYVLISDPWRAVTWLVPLAFLGLCLLSLYALRHSSMSAALLLVLALLGANAAAVWLYPGSLAPAFFAMIVVAAGVLLGPIFGVLVAGVSSLVIITATRSPEISLPLSTALSAHLLTWTGALVAWAAVRPLHTALGWAWSSYLDALGRAEELRDRQGELNRALKSLTEVCYRLEQANLELERARKAAEEARRLKAEFAANISHELRTPLNLIIGFSEMMTIAPESYGAEALPATYRGDVEAMYRNACHLSSLIDDVLDLSQIEAGRMGLYKERVALAQVVDEAVSAITTLFKDRKGLSLTVELPQQPVVLQADRTRVRQILINLLNNAARLTERGGVRISALVDHGEVVVAVADTGPGMSAEEMARVFQEFHQVGAGYQRRGGHGLGLTISKRFAEMHGGSMWVQSELGKGSTFYFSLPLSASVVTSPARAEWETWVRLPECESQEKTVLLLSLDGAAAKTLLRYLDLDGYRVVVAESLERARRVAEEQPPHAVVVTSSSEQHAWQQLAPLRDSFRNLPVLACALRGTQAAAGDLGVAEYLVKPVTYAQIHAALGGLGRRVRDVVVIEDDPEMARLLARLVRASSRRCRVREAHGGVEGLALLRQRRPDAVLLDLLMPDLDGYGVLQEMRADPGLRDVPVVVVTARGRADEAAVAPAVGVARSGGLSMRELTRFLAAALDTLAAPPSRPSATSWPEVGHFPADNVARHR